MFAADRALSTAQALFKAKQKPLTELQKRILAGAAQRLGTPLTEIAGLATALDGERYLVKQEAEARALREKII